MRIALTVLSLGALTVLTAIGVLSFDSFEKAPAGGFFYRSDGLPLMLCAAGAWALFAVALVGLRRVLCTGGAVVGVRRRDRHRIGGAGRPAQHQHRLGALRVGRHRAEGRRLAL